MKTLNLSGIVATLLLQACNPEQIAINQNGFNEIREYQIPGKDVEIDTAYELNQEVLVCNDGDFTLRKVNNRLVGTVPSESLTYNELDEISTPNPIRCLFDGANKRFGTVNVIHNRPPQLEPVQHVFVNERAVPFVDVSFGENIRKVGAVYSYEGEFGGLNIHHSEGAVNGRSPDIACDKTFNVIMIVETAAGIDMIPVSVTVLDTNNGEGDPKGC